MMLLNVIQDWTGKAFPVMDAKYKKPVGHISHHHSALAEIIVQIEPRKDLFTCHIQVAEAWILIIKIN